MGWLRCIYCLSDSSTAKGVEHVYPEGLGQHDWTLPRGAVCDRCNSGVLAKLDASFVHHPHIAATLAVFAIPGKRGRPRVMLGGFGRTRDGNLALEFPAKLQRELRVDHERKVIAIRSDPATEYRPDFFARCLLKIAMNVLAHTRGPDYVLDSDFDSARNAIARPPDRRVPPYVQCILHREMPAEIEPPSFEVYAERRFEAVRMRIFIDEFLVDLRDPGQAEELADGSWPPNANVIVHRRDGTVCRRDGTVCQPLTFDSPEHPCRDEIPPE